MIICAKCGTQLKDTDHFCSNCGEPVAVQGPVMIQCRHCGKSVEKGNLFCPECGYRITSDQEEPSSLNQKESGRVGKEEEERDRVGKEQEKRSRAAKEQKERNRAVKEEEERKRAAKERGERERAEKERELLPPMNVKGVLYLSIILDVVLWLAGSFVLSEENRYMDFGETLLVIGVMAGVALVLMIVFYWMLNNYRKTAFQLAGSDVRLKNGRPMGENAAKNYRQALKLYPVLWVILALSPMIFAIILIM